MHLLSTSLLILFFCGLANAESPEEKGLAIIIESDKKDTGWGDASADMLMTLKNKQGQESSRSIRIKMLEVIGDGDKSLTVFDSPKDIKGTAFLSHTHSLTADDQWLFLPALKRFHRTLHLTHPGLVQLVFASLDTCETEFTEHYSRDHGD